MEILTLGGTGFLSRAVVAEAVRRGHDVTTLTRGLSGSPQEGVNALYADRDCAQDLERVLHDVHVGAVIDMSGYSVEGARHAVACLADVASYAYLSSLDAYRRWPPGPIAGEDEPLWGDDDGDVTEYGPMKAASERILGAALGERLLTVRAGLMIGPGDDTGRLTSWLQRIAAGGEVVVPACLDQPMAFVDVRDLSGWLVTAVERGLSGPVNATGPIGMTTFVGLLDACRSAIASTGGQSGDFVVVAEEDLLASSVQPWRHLPFWLPHDVAKTAWQVGTRRARELGLPSRPVEESVTDTWRWMQETSLILPSPSDGGPGLPAAIQQALTS